MYGRSLPVEVPFEWCHKCTVFRVSESPANIFIDDSDNPELALSVQYSCKHAKFCKAVEEARTKHAAEVLKAMHGLPMTFNDTEEKTDGHQTL